MGMDWVKGEMSNKHWYDIIKIRGDSLFRALQRKFFGHRVCLLFSTLTHVSGCSKKKNGCVSKEAPTKIWNSAPLVSLFPQSWEAEEQGEVLRNASLTPKNYSGSHWLNIYYVSDTVSGLTFYVVSYLLFYSWRNYGSERLNGLAKMSPLQNNHSSYSLSASSVSSAVFKQLHALSHSFLTTILWDRFSYCPHSTDEKNSLEGPKWLIHKATNLQSNIPEYSSLWATLCLCGRRNNPSSASGCQAGALQ